MTARELKLTRLRNELAFIIGDDAIGGPDRREEADKIRKEIRELMEKKD